MEFVDFTTELRDPELARIALKRSGGMHVVTTSFKDTLFRVGQGTLRRRAGDDEPNEWLLQIRDESPSSAIVRTESLTDEQARSRYGTRRLPIWLSYEFRRELWMLDTVRIHIDTVADFGCFAHFQSLVYHQQTKADCERRIDEARRLLMPALGGPIATDYAILISRDSDAA
jgi:hypothetical protein